MTKEKTTAPEVKQEVKAEFISPDSLPARYKDSTEQIKVALKALNSYIWVRTHEEARAVGEIIETGKELKMDVYTWSMWQGLVPAADFENGVRASGSFDKSWQPPVALDMIRDLQLKPERKGNIVIMRDVHAVLQEPIPRQMRDLVKKLQDNRTKVIFMSPDLAHGAGGQHAGLPPTMEKQITVLDFQLPDLAQIERMVKELASDLVTTNNEMLEKLPAAHRQSENSKRIRGILDNISMITPEHFTEFARAMQGLTREEIRNTCTASIMHTKTINTQFLLDQKKQILSRSDILEYFEPNRTMSDIGGMDLMKAFFEDYKFSHTKEAKDFGIDPLRGVLFVGVPGCGKSQMCKAVASSYKLPLIRLDVGKVMTGLVGGSESKMRSAIKQVEAIAPCILWIDEVEKALSGTKSSNHSDGGTTSRVFGTLLTAMEEGMKGVTILATANDIQSLPPEFIRRFSETFFVDLPGPDERKTIFEIHIAKKTKDFSDFDLNALVQGSENYTGHEIEKAVARAMAFAFKDPDRRLKSAHVAQALTETKPIYHIMGDKIRNMRSEARDKYRYASSWAEAQNASVKAKKNSRDISDLKLPDMKKKDKSKPESTDTGSSLLID
jgi:ATP-dependent 26S proteasome regulatory subunit